MVYAVEMRLRGPRKRRSFAYNERKFQTLLLFEDGSWLRPEAYAWKLGVHPARAAYSYLKGLWRWGLLIRREAPVCYRISERGRERLVWLAASRFATELYLPD
jgi:hypothetical protein